MFFNVVVFVIVILVASAVALRINAATAGVLISVVIYRNKRVCMIIENARPRQVGQKGWA